MMLEHLNVFTKIISKLLAVEVMGDEEDNVDTSLFISSHMIMLSPR